MAYGEAWFSYDSSIATWKTEIEGIAFGSDRISYSKLSVNYFSKIKEALYRASI
jgi:hypothetical protein